MTANAMIPLPRFIAMDQLAFLGYLIVGGVLAWLAADMRSMFRSLQRKNKLTIEGRWAELEQHFERASNTRRPFAWFHQRYLLPGSNAALFALFLNQQGRLEQALTQADKAIKQIENKPALFRSLFQHQTNGTLRGALAARVLILIGMGRYDEAREGAARLGQASGSNVDTNASLALLEVNCGHLDEALALAKTVPPEHNHYDAMRGVMASVYRLRGDFAQAIESMIYEPSGIVKFYRSEDLENLSQSQEGSKLIELQGQTLAGIFPPARWIKLAGIYIAQEAFEKADGALDEAKKLLGSNPVLQISYWRTRARSCAAQGNAVEADDYIARARALIQQLPRRSTVMETHLAIGRAYLSLRRFAEALAELAEAQRFALHPIEKHQAAYWLARTYEAAGNPGEAFPYYQQVASDPIPSWMQRQAATAANELTAKIPPPTSRRPPGNEKESA
jgi:tetratricopeptide (TPR) repeat protein